MAKKSKVPSFVKGGRSAIVLHAEKIDAVTIGGLQNMVLPKGYEKSTGTVSEMGVDIDRMYSSGASYPAMDFTLNYKSGDKGHAELEKLSLLDGQVDDMRFYSVQYCDFVALDLINDPSGYYEIGTMGHPTVASKTEIYTRTAQILIAGASADFIAHTAINLGTNITTTAPTADGEDGTATLTAGTWDGFGFEEGDIVIADNVNGLDPLYLKLKTVADAVATFEGGVGDCDELPDSTGVADTQFHAASYVDTKSSITCY